MSARVLSVAESDSSGASGIQVDVKTVLALGGYASTALSAVTSQNTRGIDRIQAIEPDFVAQQMRAVLEDIGADAIKVGVLMSKDTVNAVGDVLDDYQSKEIPVVIDPSIVSRNGKILMDESAVAALKRRLYIRAVLITPNIKEAEVLTGKSIESLNDMRYAATALRTLGVENVLLKAGNAISEKSVYLLATDGDEHVFERPLLETTCTLGAGYTLSSAIAVSLGQGMNLVLAVERALDFIHQAMLYGPKFGGPANPMNHAFDIQKHSSFFDPESVSIRKA